MDYVRFLYENDYYTFKGGTSIAIEVLGFFLSTDVGYRRVNSWQDWAFDVTQNYTCSNATELEKKGNVIHLTDLYSQEKVPTACKMTKLQFFQLLAEWQEVYQKEPQEVIIKHENDQFWIETSD